MKTIIVTKVLSEQGLLTIKENLVNWEVTEIFETETKKTWENFGGFNGNPTDLWLRKKGTFGKTQKTFIRVSVSSYEYIKSGLERLSLPVSDNLKKLVENELSEKEDKIQKGLDVINEFNDVEKAAKYLSAKNGKNAHQYRTYLANKCVNMGALRNQYRILEKKCLELAKK